MSAAIQNVVIGTAGHIDHGKSSLVRVLTGIDPDRLKEEKERGLTIDLGFAPLVLSSGQKVGMIDVPGHERFVKNMVAGATGIDFVLLVIAADDGVMPQTHEHLDIMKLLGIQRGFVVVTKIDIVDEEMKEIAIETIRDFLKGTFLEGAPLFPVSSITGEGLDALRKALDEVVPTLPTRPAEGLFRMPIQRVFSAKGHGTVATGVPVSGTARPGEEIEILPGGYLGRIRHIQSYMEESEEARAGRSCALNLADVVYKEVERGFSAVTPGCFEATRLVEGRLRLLADYERTLKSRTTIRLHVGTAEVIGTVVILEGKTLEPGQTSFVQYHLEEPIVVGPGDRYVIRLHSPTLTIGGGVVFGASRFKLKPERDWTLRRLREKEAGLADAARRVESAVEEAETGGAREDELVRHASVPRSELRTILEELLASGRVERLPRGPVYLHASQVDAIRARILEVVAKYHADNPYLLFMERLDVKNALRLEPAVIDHAIETLIARGDVAADADRVRLAGHGVAFGEDQKILQDVERVYLDGAFNTPRPDELPEKVGAARKATDRLLHYLLETGVLVEIDENVLLHRDRIAQAEAMIREEIAAKGELISADFRDRLGTTRKFVIPLLDYFDSIGLTIREGSSRVLRKRHTSGGSAS